MAGLMKRNEGTPEGKYPIVLRRDGTPLASRFIVMTLKDPATTWALLAYADEAERLGMDPKYVEDMRWLASEARKEAAADASKEGGATSDPDASSHRVDDPQVLAWARSIGCPGS